MNNTTHNDAIRRLGETIEIEGEVRVGNSDVPTPVARVTPADLARWRAAADAATEGPWDADVIPHDPEEPCVPEYANVEPNIGAGLTVADAGFIAAARIAMPRLLDEVERLRETVTRLNRRAQIAESAINDLTREPIGGREHAPVAAEVWARCEETHGLVCRAAREARAELGLMRARIEGLAAGSEIAAAWHRSRVGGSKVRQGVIMCLDEFTLLLHALLAPPDAQGATLPGDPMCCPAVVEGGA